MWELVVVWDDGNKEVYTYQTEDEAKERAKGFKMAFGKQCWVCTRRKNG